jgi:alpha-galactosidase
MTYARELFSHLGFDEATDASQGRAPFALTVAGGREPLWAQLDRRSRAGGSFSAEFASPDGLHAEIHARVFSASGAVEVSGVVRNESPEAIAGVTGCSSIRLFLRLDDEPLVRTWRGVRLIPNFFPPTDFESDDRRLLRTPSVHMPLAVHAGSGGRSSSEHLPFVVVAGKRRGFALGVEWSGTWFASLAQDPDPRPEEGRDLVVCVEAGLWGTPLDLRPGEAVPLPPVHIVPFDGSVTEGSNALRRHLRQHVMPHLAGDELVPPTSFNHWFAFGNEFTDALLRPAVDTAAEVGLEYFVIDAGWFPRGFSEGIGNWDDVDHAKFPAGIADFSRYVQSKGLQYGTWFEPEFAHTASALHIRHPEWFFPAPRPVASFEQEWGERLSRSLGESLSHYRMLDFGLSDVQQYWVDRIASVYRDWGVRWIRWDFNRDPLPCWNASPEPGWAQIRHVQGLYRVWDHLLDTLPDLLIEQCASGGTRIDLGTVRHGHTFWMNDHSTHTDLVRRLQTRLNQVLPGSYANTNLSQHRHDFTDYDYLSHGCGPFGYSGRLWEMPSADLRRYAEAVARFKGYRRRLLGDYSFELPDPENRFGREAHAWHDDTEGDLVIEFNAEGPRTASVST